MKCVLLFLFCFGVHAQNSAQLLTDITFSNTGNTELFRVTGCHLSTNSTIILVVNERVRPTLNTYTNIIVVHVIHQNYTILSSTKISSLPQTVAITSAVDDSNALVIFGDSEDIDTSYCPPINTGTQTKGFIMKFDSPASNSSIFCRTILGLTLTTLSHSLGPHELGNGVTDSSGAYIYYFGNTKISNEVAKSQYLIYYFRHMISLCTESTRQMEIHFGINE